MERLIFDPKKKYVKVWISEDGKHKEWRDYNDYVPDYLRKYKIVGIFEKVTIRSRSWEREESNPEEYNGIPEGKQWDSWSKKFRQPSVYNRIPRRHEFQEKLKHILEKAKELMALGIDRKAALQAARKCSCHS